MSHHVVLAETVCPLPYCCPTFLAPQGLPYLEYYIISDICPRRKICPNPKTIFACKWKKTNLAYSEISQPKIVISSSNSPYFCNWEPQNQRIASKLSFCGVKIFSLKLCPWQCIGQDVWRKWSCGLSGNCMSPTLLERQQAWARVPAWWRTSFPGFSDHLHRVCWQLFSETSCFHIVQWVQPLQLVAELKACGFFFVFWPKWLEHL